MQHLCEAYTTGGPVLVLQHQHLSLWDGDEDYFGVLTESRSGCLTYVPDFKGKCAILLFHQESDGNFSVYHDLDNIVVVSEISAAEGFEFNCAMPPIHQAVVDSPAATLQAFGGKVLAFDATIPGKAIHLYDTGCCESQFGSRAMKQRYDAALVTVEVGTWQVRQLFMDRSNFSFSGVWLQRTIDPGIETGTSFAPRSLRKGELM